MKIQMLTVPHDRSGYSWKATIILLEAAALLQQRFCRQHMLEGVRSEWSNKPENKHSDSIHLGEVALVKQRMLVHAVEAGLLWINSVFVTVTRCFFIARYFMTEWLIWLCKWHVSTPGVTVALFFIYSLTPWWKKIRSVRMRVMAESNI